MKKIAIIITVVLIAAAIAGFAVYKIAFAKPKPAPEPPIVLTERQLGLIDLMKTVADAQTQYLKSYKVYGGSFWHLGVTVKGAEAKPCLDYINIPKVKTCLQDDAYEYMVYGGDPEEYETAITALDGSVRFYIKRTKKSPAALTCAAKTKEADALCQAMNGQPQANDGEAKIYTLPL
ncbi:hypothetical protein AAIR98_001029 [Elusimicrobium simillimum]|uniref:hypothetical protein n=1 Tax=Elusimicrobium simillimum TaxID=3143438 RepID=UPI003C6F194B